MPATPITPATRFFAPGVTKVYVVATIASLAAPTRLELDAGTDVSTDVAAIAGFSVSSEFIDTPDLGSRFVGKVPGRITANDSTITFYGDKLGADIRAELTQDMDTHVVILDGGDVSSTGKMDVYKVTVASVGKVRSVDDVLKLDVAFSIRDYEENIAVPA